MNSIHKETLMEEYRHQRKREFENSLPMKKELFLELFDYLDEKSETTECQHDFSLTRQFLSDKEVDSEKVLAFLQANGGYCDCEVLFNVEEKFEV